MPCGGPDNRLDRARAVYRRDTRSDRRRCRRTARCCDRTRAHGRREKATAARDARPCAYRSRAPHRRSGERRTSTLRQTNRPTGQLVSGRTRSRNRAPLGWRLRPASWPVAPVGRSDRVHLRFALIQMTATTTATTISSTSDAHDSVLFVRLFESFGQRGEILRRIEIERRIRHAAHAPVDS